MAEGNDVEQRIRERAFELWIEEGQPDGKDREHWDRAEKEMEGVVKPRERTEPPSAGEIVSSLQR